MTLLFEVPGRFDNPLFERVGAIIKDKATGQIVGHVQEAALGRVADVILGGGPLDLITEGFQMAQLAKLQQSIETVQTLATVSAAASVASLGVSVVGFALVLARLGRMDQKLDRVLAGSKELRQLSARLHVKIDAIQMSRLRAELEAVGLAVHFDPQRRRDALLRSIAELSSLRQYYADLLADPSLVHIGTQDALALLDAHERMTAAAEGELFAEILLGDDPTLVGRRWARQRETFNRVAWKSPLDLYELLEEGDKASGTFLLVQASERSATTRSLLATRQESLNRLESLPLLAEEIHRCGVTPVSYLEELNQASHDLNERVLVLPASRLGLQTVS